MHRITGFTIGYNRIQIGRSGDDFLFSFLNIYVYLIIIRKILYFYYYLNGVHLYARKKSKFFSFANHHMHIISFKSSHSNKYHEFQ